MARVPAEITMHDQERPRVDIDEICTIDRMHADGQHDILSRMRAEYSNHTVIPRIELPLDGKILRQRDHSHQDRKRAEQEEEARPVIAQAVLGKQPQRDERSDGEKNSRAKEGAWRQRRRDNEDECRQQSHGREKQQESVLLLKFRPVALLPHAAMQEGQDQKQRGELVQKEHRHLTKFQSKRHILIGHAEHDCIARKVPGRKRKRRVAEHAAERPRKHPALPPPVPEEADGKSRHEARIFLRIPRKQSEQEEEQQGRRTPLIECPRHAAAPHLLHKEREQQELEDHRPEVYRSAGKPEHGIAEAEIHEPEEHERPEERAPGKPLLPAGEEADQGEQGKREERVGHIERRLAEEERQLRKGPALIAAAPGHIHRSHRGKDIGQALLRLEDVAELHARDVAAVRAIPHEPGRIVIAHERIKNIRRKEIQPKKKKQQKKALPPKKKPSGHQQNSLLIQKSAAVEYTVILSLIEERPLFLRGIEGQRIIKHILLPYHDAVDIVPIEIRKRIDRPLLY